MLAQLFASFCLAQLGQIDRAQYQVEETLVLARQFGSPFTLAFAFIYAAVFAYLLGDAETVRTAAQEAYDLAMELGFPYWQWQASLLLAWSERVAPRGGLPAIEQGDFDVLQRAIVESGGSWIAYYSSLCAETMILQGLPLDARQALDQALRLAQEHGVSLWIEEVHRLQGEILLSTKSPEGVGEGEGPAEAERLFQRALELARHHGSRFLELRAALSLGRLWKGQGRTQDARELVDQARQGFMGTSRDLREAGAFLDS